MDDSGSVPAHRAMTATEGRALVAGLLPARIPDRTGWSTDIYAAIAALQIAPTIQNICSVIAVTEQESGFEADPAVPGLPRIARKAIDERRERAGIPKLALDAALALRSADGRRYGERLDSVKTEKQLSELFEDFIGMVPLARTFLADHNPVRTGGPMQVSIAFAQAQADAETYPYPIAASVRHEVFTRRGGMYFGIAHLLGYPASYPSPLYRFADFNAGRYASRNAAFQHAVSELSGIPLALDGDLLRYERGRPVDEASATETATRLLARRIDMDHAGIRRDLALADGPAFEKSNLFERVFTLADRTTGQAVPRAMLPGIALKGPKITRKLTNEWFATRVDTRYKGCLKRGKA